MEGIVSLPKTPAVSTRAHEVKEIEALLESDEFSSSTQAARKVISTALRLMTERDWWVIASRIAPGAPVTLYGMFATESAALKALATNSLGVLGEAAVFEVKSLFQREQYLAEQDAELERFLSCATCGHPEAGHHWPNAPRPGCIVHGCDCGEFVMRESTRRRIEFI